MERTSRSPMKEIKWHRNERRRPRAGEYRPQRTSMLSILVMLTCLMVIVLQGWNEWRVRAVELRESTALLSNLAGALSRQAEDTIEFTDTILATVVERLETDGTSPAALARLDRILRMQVPKESYLRHIIVLDANGDWLSTSLTTTGPNYSAQEYFHHHRDSSDRSRLILVPVRSQVNGRWIM